jgi:hypothetical protein
VAELAAAEIERFYALGIATPAEQQFFDQALSNYRAVTKEQRNITQQFKQHIHVNETQYHPEQQDSLHNYGQSWQQCL